MVTKGCVTLEEIGPPDQGVRLRPKTALAQTIICKYDSAQLIRIETTYLNQSTTSDRQQ